MTEDMTLDEMEKAAESLRYCIQQRSMEDAFNWLISLTYALHRHEFRKYVALRNKVDELAGDPNGGRS